MCGRTCLTLDPDQVLCACKYQNSSVKKETDAHKEEKDDSIAPEDEERKGMETPEWRAEFNLGRRYQASYNIAPTDITPVVVSAAHFSDQEDQKCARIVMPMMWGMIPFWHKGDYRKHGLTTNNCRLEHLMDSKLYRGPFKRGQRCVVLCEGFYEWQTAGPAKKPSEREAYLIFVPQETDVKIYDKTTWTPSNVKLLRMAGLFDVWEDESGDKMYSYSIITFQSSKIMDWMHYRMPAILETEQQMNDWLDFKRVSDSQALATLRPAKCLEWHRVTKLVNNSRNKSEECNKPIELAAKPAKPPMNKTMMAWLNVRKKREEQIKAEQSEPSDEDTDSATKRKNSSDANSPAKRQRFSDFKMALQKPSCGGSESENKSSPP
ncbi:abasic site processing protein HMCES [Drosophila pseudoobscura]|uniref:Abasic site processing protein HMCES n=1 Tax=Drosophila pseudoobscura pseudoobscura TaxID=46245 RepID=A0A6I8VPB9_DROPS|nr:abasic site processing protein HMCES [Drosophila pseudoobscura]